MLSNLDMSKDLILYIFSTDYNIALVLTLKDVDKRGEHLIAFHCKTLKEYDAKYNFVEKKIFAIVKGLKTFMHFITSSKTIV